ncbi:disease resistance protein [Trifolium repens]|nr:disease resistance protein [Trifolium repens]
MLLHLLTTTSSNNGNFKQHLLEQKLLRLGKSLSINISRLTNAISTFSFPIIISCSESQSSTFNSVSLTKLCAVEDVIKFTSLLHFVISKYVR